MKRNLFFGSALLLLVNPAPAFEVIGKATLEPYAKPGSPSIKAGLERHWLKDGEESITTYESVSEKTYSGRGSDGCSWTSVTYEFAPALKWDNCNSSSGTQKITKTKGSPWPLKAKSKFQYSFRGKYNDGGKPWTSTRKCKVKAMERVRVPAGEYDTFKIECKDKWNKRTYWFAPEVGHGVALKRQHFTDASKSYMLEFVKSVDP